MVKLGSYSSHNQQHPDEFTLCEGGHNTAHGLLKNITLGGFFKSRLMYM